MSKKQIPSNIISEFQNLQKKEIQGVSKLTAIDALRALKNEINTLLDTGWPREAVIAEIKSKLNIEITSRTFNNYWAQIQRESKSHRDADKKIVDLESEIKTLNEEVDKLNIQLNLAFKKLSQNERNEIEEHSGPVDTSSMSIDGNQPVKPKNLDALPFDNIKVEEGGTSDNRKSVNCKDKDL